MSEPLLILKVASYVMVFIHIRRVGSCNRPIILLLSTESQNHTELKN